MPARISRGFKDISLSFRRHPVTNDLVVLKDESAIAKSVRNIVGTAFGEKPFDLNFGSPVAKILFEPFDPRIAASYSASIREVVQRNEPRVNVLNVFVEARPDSNALTIVIDYEIIGLSVPPQQVTYIAKSVR